MPFTLQENRMRIFNIQRPAPHLSEALQAKIDNLNKPKGSLGRLEELAFQIGLIQQTLSPALRHPCHLLLGGDHGIERESVSVSPREVTWQQMINFSRGGGGVNMFCRQHQFDLTIVDMGVDYDLTPHPDILNCKVARGTRNFLHEPAMSCEQLDRAIDCGAMLVDRCVEKGCNIISIGEMGIANTSPSSIWMSLLGHIPLDECIGAGAGLDAKSIEHKRIVLQKAVDNFHRCHTPFPPMSSTGEVEEIIRHFGGFEMVGAIGAMLRAAERHLTVLVDGFIMGACALAATRLYPDSLHYMIFGHCGEESGHRKMLSLMQARPLLQLGMRLGEGTGALCAYPIIESAIRMINEMNNFENAHITKYF